METTQPSYLFLLPLEIRQEIYLFATPPRLVRLQERFDEDFEDFAQEIRTEFGRLDLDPSLQHFAFNWCTGIPPSKQHRLESFGFTSNKAQRYPWPTSPSMPEIPPDWLEEQPNIAWELARKSHFYSNAPIPPLLHVSRAIRGEMMNLGYRLFFRTRSSQPRTWFNVHYDTLFAENMSHNWRSKHGLISGCDWDFGQLQPDEMKLVRRLALQDGSMYFSAAGSVSNQWMISTVLRLFPGLDELLLLGWLEAERVSGKLVVPTGKNARRNKQVPDPWVILPTEELDCIFPLFPPVTPWRTGTWAAGSYGEQLTTYMMKHGHDAPFLKDNSLGMQKQLTEFMETIIREQTDTPLARWNIPRFIAAQAMPISWIERLCEERRCLREILDNEQEQWKLAQKAQVDPDEYFSEGPCSKREFASWHWMEFGSHDCSYCGSNCGQWSCFQETKRWWIEKGPRMEIEVFGCLGTELNRES